MENNKQLHRQNEGRIVKRFNQLFQEYIRGIHFHRGGTTELCRFANLQCQHECQTGTATIFWGRVQIWPIQIGEATCQTGAILRNSCFSIGLKGFHSHWAHDFQLTRFQGFYPFVSNLAVQRRLTMVLDTIILVNDLVKMTHELSNCLLESTHFSFF